MKKTQLMQQRENTGLKYELIELRKESAEMKTELQIVKQENSDLKFEVRELKKVVSNNMDPQPKDQVVNTLKVGSIEEDVQMNKEDIIDPRMNDGHHDMQIGQMLNQINNINTTLNGEIVKLDERITNVEERLTNAEMRTAVCGYRSFLSMGSDSTLTFEPVHNEINTGGVLAESGYFTATIEGVYLVTLKTAVGLD